jgi:hypothetical protein
MILTLISGRLAGQTPGDIRYPAGFATLKNVLKEYDGSSCQATPFDIGDEGKIKFISDLGSGNYLIEVVANNVSAASGANYALRNTQYCIAQSTYSRQFSTRAPSNKRNAYGFLAVPFKIRFAPTTIGPGGELGGFYGRYVKESSWMFAAHAGFTWISLNDVNAATPENKTGFTGGIALINDVANNFQIGIVTGVDLFDGVDTWEYKYAPWLSIQFGFKFTKTAP